MRSTTRKDKSEVYQVFGDGPKLQTVQVFRDGGEYIINKIRKSLKKKVLIVKSDLIL